MKTSSLPSLQHFVPYRPGLETIRGEYDPITSPPLLHDPNELRGISLAVSPAIIILTVTMARRPSESPSIPGLNTNHLNPSRRRSTTLSLGGSHPRHANGNHTNEASGSNSLQSHQHSRRHESPAPSLSSHCSIKQESDSQGAHSTLDEFQSLSHPPLQPPYQSVFNASSPLDPPHLCS